MGKVLDLDQRSRVIRNTLIGPNGQALMDFLMEEYVYDERLPKDTNDALIKAGQRDVVLRLRRLTQQEK